MHQDIARSEAWVTAAADSFTSADITTVAALQIHSEGPAEIFSYFEYSSSCGGAPLRVPMEPLVGVFRHPLVQGCAPEGHALVTSLNPEGPSEAPSTCRHALPAAYSCTRTFAAPVPPFFCHVRGERGNM